MATLVERAHELRPLIEEHAATSEQDRRLAAPAVAALTDAEMTPGVLFSAASTWGGEPMSLRT